jgi:hypothetical protein
MVRTDPFQLLQKTDIAFPAGLPPRRFRTGIPLLLHGSDHVQDQREALALAPDFGRQVPRRRHSVSAAQGREAILPIRAHRIEIPDPLSGQEPLDPVDMPDALLDQALTFSRCGRLASSSSGVGTRTMLQTCGSPRW